MDLRIYPADCLHQLHQSVHGQIGKAGARSRHPESYRFVVFKDMSNGYSFLSRSSAPTKESVKWEDGKEYPLIKLEISNMSHPFFTGQKVLVDTAGRIDKFKKKYAKK